MIRVGDKIKADNSTLTIEVGITALVRLEKLEIIKWLQPEPTNWLEMKNHKPVVIVWEQFTEAKIIGYGPGHFCLQYQSNLDTDIYDNLWINPQANGNKIFAPMEDVFTAENLVKLYQDSKQFRINDQWLNRNELCKQFNIKDNKSVKTNKGTKSVKNSKNVTSTTTNFGRYHILMDNSD